MSPSPTVSVSRKSWRPGQTFSPNTLSSLPALSPAPRLRIKAGRTSSCPEAWRVLAPSPALYADSHHSFGGQLGLQIPLARTRVTEPPLTPPLVNFSGICQNACLTDCSGSGLQKAYSHSQGCLPNKPKSIQHSTHLLTIFYKPGTLDTPLPCPEQTHAFPPTHSSRTALVSVTPGAINIQQPIYPGSCPLRPGLQHP